MNTTFSTRVVKLSLLMLILAQPALAFNQAKTVALSVGGGYDYFSSTRRIENAGVGFGTVGYNFTDNWGIEGLLGFFNSTSRYAYNFGKNVDGTMFAFDAVYHFTPFKCIQTYVLAGPGIMGFNPNGSSAHNAGNINAAVGAQIFANEIVALRLEARDFYTFTGGKNDVFLSAGVAFMINT